MPKLDDGAPARLHYNAAAGRSLGRLSALSDGLFAIALTLLVLELHAPAAEALKTQGDLIAGLAAIVPKLAIWGMSFLTLGIFWVGQATEIEALASSDRDQTWLHLAFLAAVSLVPFTTAVLGEGFQFPIAMVVYWLNIVVLGGLVWALWSHAVRRGLLAPDISPAVIAAMRRRVLISQGCYALAMLVSFIHPALGLALMFVVQLNYAVAPRFGRWLG